MSKRLGRAEGAVRVSAVSLDHGHDVCMWCAGCRKLIGRKAGGCLFIGLQKAYDTVVPFLWKVLTRIGLPPLQMIAVTRHFHGYIASLFAIYAGVCSEWLQGEQGLRQECVLSPLLSNIFAAVLTVVLQNFSEDSVIIAELDRIGYGLRTTSCDEGCAARGWHLHSFLIAAGAR